MVGEDPMTESVTLAYEMQNESSRVESEDSLNFCSIRLDIMEVYRYEHGAFCSHYLGLEPAPE